MEEKAKNITLNVEGMTCSNCAVGISRHLKNKGLKEVNTNFATGEVNFKLDSEEKLPVIIREINGLGYKVVDKPAAEIAGGLSLVEKRFYFCLLFTVPLFSHMFLPFHFLHLPWVQLLLCLPVFITGLIHFGKSAWGSVKAGVPNMDVLILIGSVSAFVYSLIGTFVYAGSAHIHNYLFFETTATIITLVLLGNVLEHRSVRQTTSAIKDLSQMKASVAKRLIKHDGHEHVEEVEYVNIRTGDLLVVNSGDKVPVDGEVVSGFASVNEAMITGESLPVEKTTSSKVIGGTIALEGNLVMMATAVGEETVLSKIIEMVKNAQHSKPAIQKLGDKVSAIFVPVVLAISALTFVSWYFFLFDLIEPNTHFAKAPFSLMAAIAVLVISCPCAMGLATPTAVMAGIGRAAKTGILIKGGSTLEEFATVKTIFFDKTGTLTTGDFSIKGINVEPIANKEEIHNLIYTLEQKSLHPIAAALVKHLEKNARTLASLSIEEKKGFGMEAKDAEGNTYYLGSYRVAREITKDDSHSVYLIKNKTLIATIDIEDDIKANALEAVLALQQAGKEVVLISGDNKKKSEEVAARTGIKIVYGEQLPEQKLKTIEEFSARGKTAMVGDGINDAPALAKAHVGISLGGATQVAIHSSQIILPAGNDIKKVYEAYLISTNTLRTIKQNLFWAFFYNVVAIPIAAAGLLNPMVAALAMAFSDVIVIGNSIWLKSKKLSE